MPQLDVFAFKANSFDTEGFIKELGSYCSDYIILIFFYEKIDVIQNFGSDRTTHTFKFFKTNSKRLNAALMPFLFFFDLLLLFCVTFMVCLKYRPRICWVENFYGTFFLGLLKKIRLCGKLIYLPADWLVNKAHKRVYSIFANNIMYPLLDYADCRMSDLVLYSSDGFPKARFEYWKKKITKREIVFSPLSFPVLTLKARNTPEIRNGVCFLGDPRSDCGLELLIKKLPEIRKHGDIFLKIIGHVTTKSEIYKKIARDRGVDSYVRFLGFVDNCNLGEALKDCFCGVNLITIEHSYSIYGIPGKQFNYLRYLLAIIATEGAGMLVPDIKQKKIGAIVEPNEESLLNSVLEIHRNQESYRKNIVDFIDRIKPVGIKELIEA